MKTPKTLIPYIGKNIELSLRDIGYGHCTVLSANKDSAMVRWYGFCPRYNDQYYGRDRYEEPYLVPNERIASVRPSRYSKAGLLILRNYYLEQDKPIFRKFEQTVGKRQETIKIAQRL